ncbi:uncharacterized protein LAESUDRAFT_688308 [Laetiporus sulphureus 93-53]|uniref:Nucleolar pre-ribosomal-associated protein 1 C-terminal domain-containing protein n=1 Tax=Laetiporus sulphureus 93-53 TaxID=1314785 RepID=A0A165B553_9APHY|nr:uncharacterized protein LAESUDRAFT_688308 [Laetiporus sulphureus 93-53]KZT00261.1 hypothetical protein LAESUDRAFT_688308 [Laetiporus sulphureus 93-53]
MPPVQSFSSRKSVSRKSHRFRSAIEIRESLKAENDKILVEALTALRNQLTVKHDEPLISPSDSRLLLIKSWLELSPGAQDLFAVWEAANARQFSLLVSIVSVLSSMLVLLSSHYTYHALAEPILRSTLSSQWAPRLNSYLGGSHTELLLVTLKLFLSLSNFAGGRERKTVIEVFAWETKSLPRLLYMRRKNGVDPSVDILTRPDIRTLFILFLVSFVDSTTSSAEKITMLEQHRENFALLFKGLWQDRYSVVRHVLEVCWVGIWSDVKVRRTLKIALFNEALLAQLMRLYERDTAEDEDPEHIPADVVHHFLLAICTHPGVGVCFQDRGWYPRETDPDGNSHHKDEEREDFAVRRGSRVYNKILAQMIRNLKVNEDARQQELALKILAACPELIAGYWSSPIVALEPRLSSKWIANIAFYGSVISLPIPESSLLLQDHDRSLYNPVPPPLFTIVDNILPLTSIKTHFSRGLQANSPLVQHCSALALAKCLLKFEAILRTFERIATSLEEEEEGQWRRRLHEVEKEIRKRVPDFQVVVGFAQKTLSATGASSGKPSDQNSKANPMRATLLSESAQRLLWLYHRCLPFLVAEARFDVGKLLIGVQSAMSSSGGSPVNTVIGMEVLRQLHVFRLLGESDQFSWSGRASGSSHSNLWILLKIYAASESCTIRAAIATLLERSLSNSLLFQHDATEITLWLDSLPSTIRSEQAKTPDGASLTDESIAVIAFLDDCAQQCVKNPYRYLEDLEALSSAQGASDTYFREFGRHSQEYNDLPSPLLMTLPEQYIAHLHTETPSLSDALAIITFIRKLVVRLSSKLRDDTILVNFIHNFAEAVQLPRLFTQYPYMSLGIRRELAHLQICLQPREDVTILDASSPAVLLFLSQVENMLLPEIEANRKLSAYELIDWFRIVDEPVCAEDIARLATFIARLHKAACQEFFEYLRPDQPDLWQCVGLPARYAEFKDELNFALLFRHADKGHVASVESRSVMIDALLSKPASLAAMRRTSSLMDHRLSWVEVDDAATADLLILFAAIAREAQKRLSEVELGDFVEHIWHGSAVRRLSLRRVRETERNGLAYLLQSTVNPSLESDQVMVRDYTSHWALFIKESVGKMDSDDEATAKLWIKYMDANDQLMLLDVVADGASSAILEELFSAIAYAVSSRPQILSSHLPKLFRLRLSYPASPALESLLATAMKGVLPLFADGSQGPMVCEPDFPTVVAKSQKQWKYRMAGHLDDINLEDFLNTEHWSCALVDVMVGLFYRSLPARAAMTQWLKSEHSETCNVAYLARIIHALLDCGCAADFLSGEDHEYLTRHFTRLLTAVLTAKNCQRSAPVDSTCAQCVCILTDQLAPLRPAFLSTLRDRCKKLKPDELSSNSLAMIRRLGAYDKDLHIIDRVMDQALSWAANNLSVEDELSEEQTAIQDELILLLPIVSSLKSHLVDPVLIIVVKHRLADVRAVHFMQLLVKAVYLKPFVVNRCIQSIMQHSQLFTLCATTEQRLAARDAIVDLLHALFHLHPTNTCQLTHIEPLLRLYAGTLSSSDMKLLSVFQLFETTRHVSVASLFGRWSVVPEVGSDGPLEALQTLDPSRMFKTCLAFPEWRTLRCKATMGQSEDVLLYDPVFATLLFAQMLSWGPPTSAPSWIQLLKTNIVSVLIRCLAAKDDALREVALAQLALLYKCLERADLQEKPHVMHILNLLQGALQRPTDDRPPCLPAYATLLLAHAFRGIFYPADFIYPLTSRFLLQRPFLDVSDVPMLLGTLYSSSDQWKKERWWIVRFLTDGMTGSSEWRILERRHTWELLASLFQSEKGDRGLRRSILEFLANITCHTSITRRLVSKHALLPWVEMQVSAVQHDEGIAWVKILENVMISSDPSDHAAREEHREILARCLCHVLDTTDCSKYILYHAAPAVLRLSFIPCPPTPSIDRLITRCVLRLRDLEKDLTISHLGALSRTRDNVSRSSTRLPPHPAHGLFGQIGSDPLEEWGECLETLWRATMSQGRSCTAWNELTPRLLIWRALAGEEKSKVGEWARRQVIANLRSV